MAADLNPTFRKYLRGRKISIDEDIHKFTLTIYEKNQIKFWIQNYKGGFPEILPVSKRFALDFSWWNHKEKVFRDVLLIRFKKSYFNEPS